MLAAGLVLLAPADHLTGERLKQYEYSQVHMGVRVRIVAYAPTSAIAERACAAAFQRFAELDATMSDYRPDSELLRLCAQSGQGPIPVSEDLFRVLSRSIQLSRLTDGAFDVTAGPLVSLWRESRKTQKLPDTFSLRQAMGLVGYQKMLLDPIGRTVELTRVGMRLDLGGIAKGYACDEALRALTSHRVKRALVEAGGDVAVSGPPPGAAGWRVAVFGTSRTELLAHAAISTSGDTEQFVEIHGIRYSHILDPRTGVGVTSRVQATVVAKDAMTTDSLATALCVVDEPAGVALAARYRATSFLFRR